VATTAVDELSRDIATALRHIMQHAPRHKRQAVN
jgi:hypothetical protein